jgi:hypothetical protein
MAKMPMNKIRRFVAVLFGLTLVQEISIAQVLVYKFDPLERPFVLSRSYIDPISKYDISEVIEARTLSTKTVGVATEVTLSNAVIFTSDIPWNFPVNSAAKINQQIITADKLVLRLDSKVKIVQNSVSGIGANEGTNALQYVPPPPEPNKG